MKKIILIFGFIIISASSIAQVITPFTVRKTITQKGGILYLSNTSSKATPDNVVQNEMPPAGTGYDNNFTNGYVDIDGDTSTFMSSSDKISIPNGDPSAYSACSEISWAGLYWGGAINSANTNYAVRNQVKLKINTGSYVTLNADYLKDNAIGFKTYHCFKDITSFINPQGLSDTFTVANVVNDIGAKNLFGGWTIVIIYKDNTTTMKNLTVFDGLANVSSGTYSTVDIPISGFQTPLSGPVNFQLGLVVYDGDRSLTGDQLMFKGASSFINLSDAIHNSTDMFNSTLSRNGVLTSQRNPNYNNTLGYDANIFNPNNSTKNYIGNNAISATIRQTTGGETFLTQVVTSAIDVYEPDLRSAVTVENITHPGAAVASPGDLLEYTVSGLNIGSDPAVNTYITDKIEGNAAYVPNSIVVTYGPNSGAKTDAAGDDQAEYIASTKTIKVRIGTGANSFQGGQIDNSPTGIDHTLIKFRVQISSDCVYMYCDNVVDNSAHITGTGNISGNIFDNASNPGVFDSNGCAISGTTATPVNITGCAAPTVTVNSPICPGGNINLTATSSPSATYLWTGPNGFTSTSTSPTISNVSVANSGTYTANIYVTGTGCHFVYPIVVEVNAANAGQDLTGATTCGLTNITLAGNSPTGSTGEWTIISGTGGSFGTAHTSTSTVATDTFYGTAGSTYVLRWTLTATGCSPTYDEVTITFNVKPSLAALSGSSVTCNNNLSVAITGGTSPYTLNINNGVGTISGYTTGTSIPVNPIATTTYTLSSLIDANGCTPASITPNTYQLVITNSMGTGTITANTTPTQGTTATVGPNYPTSSSDGGGGTTLWTSPSNVNLNDGLFATFIKNSTSTSNYLNTNNYGFAIPTNATITGISVDVYRKSNNSTTSKFIKDANVELTGGAAASSNLAVTATKWPTTVGVATYGGTTNLWGTTWTPAQINSSTFGPRIKVVTGSSSTSVTASIDYIRVSVTYSVLTNYCDTDSSVSYTVSGFSNATTYTWTPPAGASIVSGQGTTTAVFNFNGSGQSGNYTVAVTPSNSCGAGTPATKIVPIVDCANSTPYCVKGTVYWDTNSSTSTTGKVDGTGIGIVNSSQLYVTLAKTSGTTTSIVTTPVASDGTWSICDASIVSNTAFRVTLSKNNYANGTAATSVLATLPTGASNNGEINNDLLNSLSGNDATVNGNINFTTVSSLTNNETNLNFGLKINTPPVANNDTATTNEDTPVTFSLTNNDTDVDGTVTASSVTLSTASSNGSWSVDASGNVTYTPALNFNGTASITYTVKDNDVLTSNSGTISVIVAPVNDPPVALASFITATENTAYQFLTSNFNYSDIESNTSSGITIISLPALGTLTLNGNPVIAGQTISNSDIINLLYTPNVDEYGANYTTFNFMVNDANLGLVSATMTINVNHTAGPPIAQNDAIATNQDTAVSFNILTNDINSDGTLTTSSVDLDPLTAGQQTTFTTGEGTYSVAATGVLTFTPTTGYYGITNPLSYTVMNSYSSNVSNEATIIITVLPAGAPIANNDITATTTLNNAVVFNVTTNDTALNSHTINASRVDLDPNTIGIQQANYVDGKGQFSVDMNGDVTFAPDWNYSGSTSVNYTVKDSANLLSNVAVITVNTVWANSAPFAVDDFASTNEDAAVTFNVTSNDYDLDTTHGNSGVINNASVDLDPYTAGIQTTFTVTGQGTFTVNSSGNVTFTPVLNFNGTVTPIEYVVNDSDASPLTSNSGFLYVTVASVNDAPVAVNDAATIMIATDTIFSISNNDTDVDGTIDLTSIDLDPYTTGVQKTYSVSGQGTYSVDNLGNITFTHTYASPITTLTTIYYTIKDNNGLVSNLGSITITLTPGVPTATDDTLSTNEDVAIIYNVTSNDTDVNGVNPGINPSTVTLIGTLTSSSGTWSITDSINNPGSITFTPAADFSGTATIQYSVRDLDGNLSNTATITLTIASVNDTPSFTAGADQAICYTTSAQTISGWATSIFAGPSNESSQTVSFNVSNDNNSLFAVQPAISATGVLTYTPAANQSGTSVITVSISDNGGTANGAIDTSNDQTFNITIDPISVAGTISGGTTVCTGTNSTILTLSGYTGTIQWQSASSLAGTYTNISGATLATYTAANLSATKYYKAVVTSGACSSATTTAASITVDPASVAGTISGSATVCSGTNSTTLTLAGYTGTIQWQSSSTLAGPYSNISGATSATYTATNLTATTYYKVVVTSGTCSSATTASAATITVNPVSVAGSISGASSVCSGTNSTVLTLSGYTGTIQWQSANSLAGTYTNISGATSATYTATNLTATTYYKAVVTSGVCSAATASAFTLTVNTPVTAGSISGAGTVCSATTNSTVLTLNGSVGSIQWQSSSTLAGTYTNISGATSATYTATNLSANTYFRAVISSGSCTSANTSSVLITVLSSNVWTGSVSTAWNNAANWSCGIPASGENIEVPGGLTNYPILDGPRTIGSVLLANGATINLNNSTLTISGAITGTGTIIGSTTSSLTINGSGNQGTFYMNQTTPGTSNVVANFTLNSTATGSATLGNAMGISGILTLTNGTFNTGGNLTLMSNGTSTAVVAPITDCSAVAINGDVTVERYFPARRAFRFISSPVTTTTTIRDNWQEGVNNPPPAYTTNLNPHPGYGTHITGNISADYGFDVTQTTNNSMFTFNNSTGVWAAVPNTNVLTLTAGVPYRLLIRGDRSISMSTNAPTPTNTTLRVKGALKICDASAGTMSATANGYNFIGNPYQATVDIKQVLTQNAHFNNNYYWVWDPKINTRGGYVAYDLSTGINPVNGSQVNQYLQPWQGCFIKNDATAGGSITFHESNKSTSTVNENVYKTTTTVPSYIRATLYESNTLATTGVAVDGFVVKFDSSFDNLIDANDAPKLTNQDEIFATKNNTSSLAIESRIFPVDTDVIPLSITQYRNTNYTIVAQGNNMSGLPAYLHDQLLQTYTEIPQSDSVSYSYSISTTDAATSAPDRFRIVFQNPNLSTTTNSNLVFTLYPNPSKQGVFDVIMNNATQDTKLTIYNSIGQAVYTTNMTASPINHINPNKVFATGVYYVKIAKEGATTINKLIIE